MLAKGVLEATGEVGVVGDDVGGIPGEEDESGGRLVGTVGHEAGVGPDVGGGGRLGLNRGGRGGGSAVGDGTRRGACRGEGALPSQGVGSGGDGLVRRKEIEGAAGARPEPDAEVGVVVVPKDLPGEGLHVGDGDVAQAYGIDPVGHVGGYGEGGFLGEGEVSVVGPVGKAAGAIDEGELEFTLPHEGLARNRDAARIGEHLGGGLDHGGEAEKTGKEEKRKGSELYHDACENVLGKDKGSWENGRKDLSGRREER